MEEQRRFANLQKYQVWDLLLLEVQLDHEQWVLIHPWVLTFFIKPALNCPSLRKQSGEKVFGQPDINIFSESEVKWSDVWPSMGTHIRNLCSAFNPSKCAHTPGAVVSHIATAPGEQLGIWFLLKGLKSVVVLRVEESAGYSLQNQNGLIIEIINFGGD